MAIDPKSVDAASRRLLERTRERDEARAECARLRAEVESLERARAGWEADALREHKNSQYHQSARQSETNRANDLGAQPREARELAEEARGLLVGVLQARTEVPMVTGDWHIWTRIEDWLTKRWLARTSKGEAQEPEVKP